MTKKKPVFGALPVLNMPSRSHGRENVQPRRSLERVQTPAALQTYQSFAEVCRNVPQLKEVKENWEITLLDDRVILRKTKVPYLLPECEIVIDDSLEFTLSVFHWLLPENHKLYKTHYRCVKHIDIQQLFGKTKEYVLCKGVTNIQQYSGDIKHHVIPKSHDPLSAEDDEGESSESYHHDDTVSCQPCSTVSFAQVKQQQSIKKRLATPAKLKAPISKTTPESIKLALQEQRLQCANL